MTFISDRRARTDRRGGVTLFEAAGSLLLLAAIVAAGCFASLDLAAGDGAVPAHAARRARAEAVSRASLGSSLLEVHLQRGGDVDRGALLAADLSTTNPSATVDVTVAAELAARTPARGAKSPR